MKKWEARLLDKSATITTEIVPASTFHGAENYHQKFLDKTGRSCHISKRAFKL
jgi:peptide methionine sulfoxide reductase MsrA